MKKERVSELIQRARAVAENAHAPYSRFKVGAAILADDGEIYVGCNVENASFGATVCAERAAISAMVSAGGKKAELVAVYTSAAEPTFPCGVCRQVLNEFARDTLIVAVNDHTEAQMPLAELLPRAFVFDS